MPIPHAVNEDTLSDADAQAADADYEDYEDEGSNGEAPKKTRAPRTRKVAPEGVAVGLFDTIELEEPPAAKPFGGRASSEDAIKVIDTCEANAGHWFKIGRFATPSAPQGVWADHGIKFAHRADPDVPGFSLRYAMKPIEGQ